MQLQKLTSILNRTKSNRKKTRKIFFDHSWSSRQAGRQVVAAFNVANKLFLISRSKRFWVSLARFIGWTRHRNRIRHKIFLRLKSNFLVCFVSWIVFMKCKLESRNIPVDISYKFFLSNFKQTFLKREQRTSVTRLGDL